MNYMPNAKIEILIAKNQEADNAVARAAIIGHDDNIRLSIDKRRQVRAILERECMAQANSENATIESFYKSNAEISEFISLWTKRGQRIQHSLDLLENIEYCDLILDAYIPDIWNWKHDLVILVHPTTEHIFNALLNRGQKNIIAYVEPNTLIDTKKIKEGSNTLLFADNIRELTKQIAQIRTRARHITKLYCDPFHKNGLKIRQDIDNAVKFGRKDAQINVNTNAAFSRSWASNILKNMPKMANAYNFCNFKVSNTDDAIVVAPGPSLEKNIDLLATIQDNIFIIAPLRSLQILEHHGIRPDLVVQVDALSDEDARYLVEHKPKKVTNLFLEATVNPVFFDLDAENIIWSLIQEFPDIHELYQSVPTPFKAPSVAIFCTRICLALNIKNICLLGQDLAIDGDRMYAEGATSNLKNIGHAKDFDIAVPGFWGGEVKTRQDYAFYIEQYELLAEQYSEIDPLINLFNATEGGAYINGLKHIRLIDFIEIRGLKEKNQKKLIHLGEVNETKSAQIQFYRKTISESMQKIIRISDKIIEIEQSGKNTAGANKKLQRLLTSAKKLNSQLPILELAMQNEISIAVGNNTITNSIPSYSEFFCDVKKVAKILAAAAQA